MFFSPDFEMILNFHGQPLRMGSVLPKNKKQISDGLKLMSPESIRNRFLGIKSGFSEKELDYLTDVDGINHYALGVEEIVGEKRGVAVIRLVRLKEDPTAAEIAITIIDTYQRRGLGSILLDLIILAAIERKISHCTFTYLRQNTAIEKLIKKKGVMFPGPKDQDYVQQSLRIEAEQEEFIRSRLRPFLPQIDNYHSET
jgi:GNAT superfamily N-acetyltransferase